VIRNECINYVSLLSVATDCHPPAAKAIRRDVISELGFEPEA
jgi:hypothetical protein